MTAQEEKYLISSISFLKREIGELKNMLQPQVPKDDKFLNFNQAMKELGVGRSKLYSMLHNGELPFATKLGCQWRFSQKAIRAYLGNTE